jgi:hypothetical protein
MAEVVEVARIEIVRTISDESDGDIVTLDATEGLTMIEGLGMIELAKDTWLRSNGLTLEGDID